MTYDDLLKVTAERKKKAIAKLNAAVNNDKVGFLCRAELEENPGTVAWLWLAKGFCETLAEHVGEWIEAAGVDSYEAREIGAIYMAYENEDSNLYELLPIEAQLFAE